MNLCDLDLEASLLQSATDVLESMYFTGVLGVLEESGRERICAGSTASLDFRGELSGWFTLHVGAETARRLAANFFGEEEPADVSEASMVEMIGEMANMICGSVLSGLATQHPFKLSCPLVAVEAQGKSAMNADEARTNDTKRVLLETECGVLALCLKVQ